MAKQKQLYNHRLINSFKNYWKGGAWHKALIIFVLLIAVWMSFIYGVAEWYIHSEPNKPQQLGVSFIPDYATYLGVDPQANMDALIGIGVKQFRLVSYWSDGEPSKGQYDFTQLDWEFAKAEKAHASVILTLGLRQPRWPECHIPDWASNETQSIWQPQLENYMSAVVNRYKSSPSLQSYQLENEYFLKGFGLCTNYDPNRLTSEYNLVRSTDPNHPIIIPRSDNALGVGVKPPVPDMYSISIYRRVWDATLTHRYLEYPFPSWYYAFLGGLQKMVNGKDTIIGELQAEAWSPNGQTILQTNLSEQSKTLNAHRLQQTFTFGKNTGMKQIELWGGEYWYYRKVVLHDPSLWNVAQQEYSSNQ